MSTELKWVVRPLTVRTFEFTSSEKDASVNASTVPLAGTVTMMGSMIALPVVFRMGITAETVTGWENCSPSGSSAYMDPMGCAPRRALGHWDRRSGLTEIVVL